MIAPNLPNKPVYFCGGKKCCPSFKFVATKNEVNCHIRDDFNGEVTLSILQLKELKNKLNEMTDL